MNVSGNCPNVLYRVFKEYKYAKEFTQGIIRFSTFEYYSSTDDPIRQDNTEGESCIKHNGLNYYHCFSDYNKFYILSFCKTLETAQENKKFGNFIVKITNPKKLAKSITNYLEKQSFKCFGGIEGNQVSYNYENAILQKPNSQELSKLSCFQKPNSYKDENEFRFIITTENKYITLETKKDAKKMKHLYITLDKNDEVLNNMILI